MLPSTYNMFYSRLDYVTRLTGNRQDAEDVIQNVLLKLCKHCERFEALNEKDQVNYCRRAIRNETWELKSYSKREKRNPKLLSRGLSIAPEIYSKLELKDTMKKIYSRSFPLEILMTAEGYSSGEIALKTNSQNNNVIQKVFQMRKYLKRCIAVILLFCFLQTKAQYSYHWRQISGPARTKIENPNAASTIATGLNKTGLYQFEFTVSNNFGKGYDTVNVTQLGKTRIKIQQPHVKKIMTKSLVRQDDILTQIKSPVKQQITVKICDLFGRKMAETGVNLIEGNNIISLPQPAMHGTYILWFGDVSEKVFL